MCGINGIIYVERSNRVAEQLARMNNEIIHRGPDDAGIYLHEERIGLAMRRLSIIDLHSGQQPICNDTGDIVIVFNGEIYNYRSLKADLENEGIIFKTRSDTEVVLRLYERYGKDCLDRLNGMFGFAIHDQRRRTLFIARDRFGEKPLYYYNDGTRFLFASELKSIVDGFPQLKKISADALRLFLSLTYIPAPHTIYQDVFKLRAAHWMEVDTDTLQTTSESYWDVPLQPAEIDTDYDAAKKRLRNTLFESVAQRMIADVPLGVFLSGGVDSTIVAAIMAELSPQKIKTFTVGYADAAYDESGRASQIAEHIRSEHHVYRLTHADMLDAIDRVILNYDEPFADSSALPVYFIASKAVQEVKVALTGDGGDEVFGGYNKYGSLRYRKLMERWLPPILRNKIQDPVLLEKLLGGRHSKSLFTKARRFLSSMEGDVTTSHLNIIALGFRQPDLQRLLREEGTPYKEILLRDLSRTDHSELKELKLLRYLDKETSLEGDMLVKVDRASMLCSLECRAPLLDHRLMEMTYTWPDRFLIDGKDKKHILKDTFRDLLPGGFFNAPKSGFEVPVGAWLRNELRSDVTNLLSQPMLARHGLFDTGYVQQLLNAHLTHQSDHAWKIWTLYCFQKWYVHNFS